MKVLNKLTLRNLLVNKKRTIITILGISLSSMLMFLVATAAGTYKNMHYQLAIEQYGDQQVIYNEVPLSKEEVFSKNEDVEKYYYLSKIDNFNYLNEDITLYSINNDFYGDMSLNGKTPENDEEVIVSREFAHIKKISIGDDFTFENETGKRTFKIVGIFESNRLFSSSTILTKQEDGQTGRFYVYFKNYDDITNKIGSIAYKLDFRFDDSRIDANVSLISLYTMYGEGAYSQAVMILATMFIMLIVSFIVLFVIYNSFIISVNERKKSFAMYKSLGATSKQILKTVLFEGFIISLIAIPLGFILNVLVGYIAIVIINNILVNIIPFTFHLSFDIIFIIISLLYIFACVFIACFMPAKRASESTIINTIRQNTEFTKKGSLFKENKLVDKIFKIEGTISRKNIIRNYRKYNVTTFSVILGCILFLSISTIVNALNLVSQQVKNASSFDKNVYLSVEYNKGLENSVENFKNYEAHFKSYGADYYCTMNKKDFHLIFYDNAYCGHEILDSDNFNKLLEVNSLKDKDILIYNLRREYITNELYESTLKSSDLVLNKPEVDFNLNLYGNTATDVVYKGYTVEKYPEQWEEDFPASFKYSYAPIAYINMDAYGEIKNNIHLVNYEFKTNDHVALDKEIKQFLSDNDIHSYSVNYRNEYLGVLQTMQLIKAINFVSYLVLFIICIITVTSIVNTVNTNMELRRREFAVLKSLGLSNKSFHKMIFFESLMLSGKALFFGLLISLGIIFLMLKAFLVNEGFENLFWSFIPYQYIIFCIIVVFLIVYISMLLSTRKFKNDNVIDAIREEIM